MKKIIYYVATSIDGFICGPNDDISGFNQKGNGVEKYLNDLKSFDTVIMGRRTYEFGYQYGLQPGQPAYEHMDHFIFSNTLSFQNAHPKVKVCNLDIEIIKSLKEKATTDIYLCGGGQFAEWLLQHEMIDEIKLKLNPFIQGNGIKMFSNSEKMYQLQLSNLEQFDHGLQMLTYKIIY